MSILGVVTVCALVLAEPLAIANDHMRIEVEPDLFAVRYVGRPGGRNFVEPLFVDPEDINSAGWVDGGGLQTDLLPFDDAEPALRRGPAEVIKHTDHEIVMLSPWCERRKIRVRKDIALARHEGRAIYRVTVLSAAREPVPLAVRNTARVPVNDTLRVARDAGSIQALSGAQSAEVLVGKSNDYWLVPVPPASQAENVVLAAFVPQVIHKNRHGTWIRTLRDFPKEAESVPGGQTLLMLMDTATQSYAASLQGEQAPVSKARPLVFVEEWVMGPNN